VRLVAFGGSQRLIGFAGLTNGQANSETKAIALQRLRLQGFQDSANREAQAGSG
jgi:hypothetical protein